MVSIYKQDNVRLTLEGKKVSMELRGLSTDEKPKVINRAIVDNGSSFIEIDTGKVFLYDLDSETWKEI